LTSGRHGSYYDTERKVEQSQRLPTKIKTLIPRVKTMSNVMFSALTVEQEEALVGGQNELEAEETIIEDLTVNFESVSENFKLTEEASFQRVVFGVSLGSFISRRGRRVEASSSTSGPAFGLF
jgi:hypothetical protein